MGICASLVIAGVVAAVRWGGLEVQPARSQAAPPDMRPAAVARRFLRSVTLAVVAGAGAGVLVAGAGGRLAMRLLAVTAGDDAQGRLTEADEIVGQISIGGTVSFIAFTALLFGTASGILYMLVRRWLPGGRLGALTYGVLLLVLAATRLEPLRADNPDFGLVGPGWLAALVFGAVVVLHGMLVAALAARYSKVLQLASRDRRSLATYTPLVVLLPIAPAALALAIIGGVTVALSRIGPVVGALRSHGARVAGRVAVAVAAVAALPGCVTAIVDIA